MGADGNPAEILSGLFSVILFPVTEDGPGYFQEIIVSRKYDSASAIVGIKSFCCNPPCGIGVGRIFLSVFRIYDGKVTVWSLSCRRLLRQIMDSPGPAGIIYRRIVFPLGSNDTGPELSAL